MSEKKEVCVCGWDAFEVEIQDANASTFLRCTRCGRRREIKAKASQERPTPGRPTAEAVNAICRDFDADRLMLKASGSENPLDFPRP